MLSFPVIDERGVGTESSSTFWTQEGLFSSVNRHMNLELLIAGESFGAFLTRKRTQAGVRPHMSS